MNKDKWLIPIIIVMVLIYNLGIIIACLRYDNYINELEEKAHKYEMIENKVGDVE